MALESATFISDLDAANPPGTDNVSEGDNHLRLLKSTLKATFVGMAGRAFRRSVKTANYTVVLNDNTVFFACDGAITLALTAAETLGNGFIFFVRARTSAVTIDPNGAELINATATFTVPTGATAIVFCTGTSFRALSFADFAGTAYSSPVSSTAGDFNLKSNTNLANANAVLTAANLIKGLFQITPTAARTLTLDTATAILAAIPGHVDGSHFEFTVVNNASYAVSIAVGTGVTLIGRPSVNFGSSTFKIRRTSATTVECWRVDGAARNQSAAQRTRGSAQAIANETDTIIAYNTLVFDNLSELSSSGVFTARAVSGIYAVIASVATDSAAWAAGERMTITVWKNGAEYSIGTRWYAQVAHTGLARTSVSTTVSLLAGEYIDIRVIHNQGASINLAANPLHNHMSVYRVA